MTKSCSPLSTLFESVGLSKKWVTEFLTNKTKIKNYGFHTFKKYLSYSKSSKKSKSQFTPTTVVLKIGLQQLTSPRLKLSY